MTKTDTTATVAEYREKLTKAVELASTEEGWRSFLELRAAQHSYSWSNTMMILMQCPDATLVGGAKNFWKGVGRYPAKGSKALRVFAPLFGYGEDKKTGEKFKYIRGFRLVPVFDVSQTAGDPIPEHPALHAVTGDAPEGMIPALVAAADADGVTITYDHADLGEGCKGDYNRVTKKVRIAAGLSECEVATTIAHELSHHFDLADEAAKGTTYADAEVVAESSCYIIATHWGVNTEGFSTGYVTGWAKGDSKRIEGVAKRIDAVAGKILAAAKREAVAA